MARGDAECEIREEEEREEEEKAAAVKSLREMLREDSCSVPIGKASDKVKLSNRVIRLLFSKQRRREDGSIPNCRTSSSAAEVSLGQLLLAAGASFSSLGEKRKRRNFREMLRRGSKIFCGTYNPAIEDDSLPCQNTTDCFADSAPESPPEQPPEEEVAAVVVVEEEEVAVIVVVEEEDIPPSLLPLALEESSSGRKEAGTDPIPKSNRDGSSSAAENPILVEPASTIRLSRSRSFTQLSIPQRFPSTSSAPHTPNRVSLISLLLDKSESESDSKLPPPYPPYQPSKEESMPHLGPDLALCCVCMSGRKGAAFIPCGHTFCRRCSRELWKGRGTCPLCNHTIFQILDIY